MKFKNCLTIMAVLVTLTLFTGIGNADLLSNCGTCQGSTYLLQYNPNNTTTSGADTVYDVFLTIDTSGYTGGGSFLNAVAIKIASSVDVPPSTLVAAPGGAANWAVQFGGINAGGCDGAGNGFICAQDGQTAPVPNATAYTWEFHYATTAAIDTSSLGSAIKAQYVDASGNKVGALVSEGITLQSCPTCGGTTQGGVPEPTSILLLASTVGLAGFKLRKQYAKS